ncbi:MAG: F0F1 ATP synthase subunit alpha [Polyangiales bacterium]
MEGARSRLESFVAVPQVREFGTVLQVGDGIASLSGLRATRLDEVLHFGGGARGMAVALDRDRIGAILLDPDEAIRAGSEVTGTGEVVRTPVGESLLGRIVDPLGRPLDGGPPIVGVRRDPIERPAPGIIDRDLVSEPLHTGVLVVDAMIPLGRGQRELIIGDRSTGKSSIAIDTILNQRRSDVVCVYAAIGQRASAVGRLVETVRAKGSMARCVFVVTNADDPPGLQWIAPYAACTIAEYFRDEGGHALLVIDDLTKHAIIHRQISLLLRDPPGREAYPGDIFYTHSRLLERASKLSKAKGGGSLTALPIAETQAGNLSAYIPTNLISITDGQIYLETRLFHEGQKPAVSTGKSVSRVGAKAQAKAMKELAGTLKLDYAQFLELEVFTRFGQVTDPATIHTIERGRRIRAVLQQPEGRPYALATEVALLLALREGVLDSVPVENIAAFELGLEDAVATACSEPVKRVEASGELSEADRAALLTWLRARALPLQQGKEKK